MTVLGLWLLRVGFLCNCGEQGPLFGVVNELLIAVASLVLEQKLAVASFVLEQKLGASVVAACMLTCTEAGGIFPDQGSNPCALPWQEDFLSTAPPGRSQGKVLYSFV